MKNYALIFPESALKQLAQHTPITKDEMIEQIDHFNATIVEKYQAHRFLEICLKYSMELTGEEELYVAFICFEQILPNECFNFILFLLQMSIR